MQLCFAFGFSLFCLALITLVRNSPPVTLSVRIRHTLPVCGVLVAAWSYPVRVISPFLVRFAWVVTERSIVTGKRCCMEEHLHHPHLLDPPPPSPVSRPLCAASKWLSRFKPSSARWFFAPRVHETMQHETPTPTSRQLQHQRLLLPHGPVLRLQVSASTGAARAAPAAERPEEAGAFIDHPSIPDHGSSCVGCARLVTSTCQWWGRRECRRHPTVFHVFIRMAYSLPDIAYFRGRAGKPLTCSEERLLFCPVDVRHPHSLACCRHRRNTRPEANFRELRHFQNIFSDVWPKRHAQFCQHLDSVWLVVGIGEMLDQRQMFRELQLSETFLQRFCLREVPLYISQEYIAYRR